MFHLSYPSEIEADFRWCKERIPNLLLRSWESVGCVTKVANAHPNSRPLHFENPETNETFDLSFHFVNADLRTTIPPSSSGYSQARSFYKTGVENSTLTKLGDTFYHSINYYPLGAMTIHDILTYTYFLNPKVVAASKDRREAFRKVMKTVRTPPSFERGVYGLKVNGKYLPWSSKGYANLSEFLSQVVYFPLRYCKTFAKSFDSFVKGGEVFIDFFFKGIPTFHREEAKRIVFDFPTPLVDALEWERRALSLEDPKYASKHSRLSSFIGRLQKPLRPVYQVLVDEMKPRIIHRYERGDCISEGSIPWNFPFYAFNTLFFMTWREGDGLHLEDIYTTRLSDLRGARFKYRSKKSTKTIHPLDCPREMRRSTYRYKDYGKTSRTQKKKDLKKYIDHI